MTPSLRQIAILVAAIGLFIGLWLVHPHEFVASDPWNYSSRAFGIASRLDFGPNDVFSHRLGVNLPAAVIYRLFGVTERTTDAWPLAASILIIVVVYLALPDPRSKAFGALLCATSVALIGASTELLPDLIAAAFMCASSLLLFRRRSLVHEWRCPGLLASLSIVLVFAAFVAKESAYWILPLWIAAVVVDVRSEAWPMLWRRFYLPAMLTGVVIGVAYLVFCQLTWGHALARFSAIQNLTGQHLWAWTKTSTWELTKRLTISPIVLLTSQYGALVLALAGMALFLVPGDVRPWAWYTVVCLFFYWFGSTSFTRYEPMPLFARMTLPALPGLYVLAAYGASRVSLVATAATWKNRWLPIALLALIVTAPLLGEMMSWRGHEQPEKQAMAIVKDTVMHDPGRTFLLVASDPRSRESLAFFFGYRWPPNLTVQSAEELVASGPPAGASRAFMFANRDRSVFLHDTFGSTTYDAEIAETHIAPTYDVAGVSLRITDDVTGLRQHLLTASHLQ